METAEGPAGGWKDACRTKLSVAGALRHTSTRMPRIAAKAAISMGPAHESGCSIHSA